MKTIQQYVVSFFAVCLIILSFFILSCRNSFDTPQSDTPETTTPTGTLALTVGINSGYSRTALPALPTLAAYTFELKTSKSPNTLINGTYPYYTMPATIGTHTVTLNIKKDGNTVLTGSTNLAVTLGMTEASVIFVIAPPLDTSGNGTVNLKLVADTDTGITNFDVTCDEVEANPFTWAVDASPAEDKISGTLTTTSDDGIAYGDYVVTIHGKDADNAILYTRTEVIRVLPSLETNRWVDNTEAETEMLTITANDMYTTFYVCGETPSYYGTTIPTDAYSQPSDGTNNGGITTPFETVGEAVSRCKGSAGYTIYVDGTTSENDPIALTAGAAVTIKKIGSGTATIKRGSNTDSMISVPAATLTMIGITLDGNNTQCSCNGAGINTNGTLTLDNCTITNCQTSGNGGGVYVDNDGTFNMSGAACVDADNDVYLTTGKKITITSTLADGAGATITLQNYINGTQLLQAGAGFSLQSTDCDKFTVTKPIDADIFSVSNTGSLQIAPFTITYHIGLGSHVNSLTHTYGTETSLTAATRPGYIFNDWYTTNDFSGTAVTTLGATEYTGNITLYAQWTANTYTVTLDANGGSGNSSVTATYDADLPDFTAVTRAGYTLSGYFTELSGGTKVINANGTLVANVTSYTDDNAKWIKDSTATLYAQWNAPGNETTGITINGVVYDKTTEKIVIAAETTATINNTDNSSWSSYYSGTTSDYKGVFIAGRKVTLSPFVMGTYEVTQELYTAVMGSNPISAISNVVSGETQELRPVENVSWYDAIAFCNELTKKVYGETTTECVYTINGTNVTQDITKKGYRLPTEAEWEFAARGGNPSAEAWTYAYAGNQTEKAPANFTSSPYNDDALEAYGWYSSNADSKTHEVGKKAANALGLYDMSGNVWEWCWDLYNIDATVNDAAAYTENGAMVDPRGASSGSARVGRGGAYCYFANCCAVSYRFSLNPGDGSSLLGFRVCRSSSEN